MTGERAPNGDEKIPLREHPIEKVAGVLQDLLGRQLSAYAICEEDPRRIGVYARGEETPDEEVANSLRDLADVVDALADQRADSETMRAWMIGNNPLLDTAPFEAFHNGAHQETVNAAGCIGRT